VLLMAPLVRCPVVLMQGTADPIVPEESTRNLEAALRAAGTIEVRAKYYEGGGHALEPVSDRKSATIALADDLLRGARHEGRDDFAARRKIVIPCITKQFVIDWGKEPSDPELIGWQHAG